MAKLLQFKKIVKPSNNKNSREMDLLLAKAAKLTW